MFHKIPENNKIFLKNNNKYLKNYHIKCFKNNFWFFLKHLYNIHEQNFFMAFYKKKSVKNGKEFFKN